MRRTGWGIELVVLTSLVWACSGTIEPVGQGVGEEIGGSGGSAGSDGSGGSAGSSSAGTSGSSGAGAGGGASGSAGAAGSSGRAGAGGSGGSSGSAGTAGSGGRAGAGGSGGSSGSAGSSGSGGRAGAGGSGGSSGSAGSGGSGGCTPNLSCRPAAPPATGNPHVDCVTRINQFRACVCLPPLQRWTEAESCANQQVAYDRARNAPHAGFGQGICSPRGSAQNECLGGTLNSCQQAMFNEGPPPTQPCTGACYQEHGHFINMTNTGYTRVACGFDGDWSVQNFQ